MDVIFHPEPEEMYTPQFCSYVDMNGLTTELCGKTRPTHFRGVQTVVLKLFHIVTPDRAYFGVREIKRILKECVDTEDKEKPYTDDELAETLKTKGYPIARRTVAKYRQQLNIPVARLRR